MLLFIYDLVRRRIRFKNMKVIVFIHVPKTGGLGITKRFYSSEIGHHSLGYFKKRYGHFVTKHMCEFIAVTRDPVERFISAINYLPHSRYQYDQEFYLRHKHIFDEEDWANAISDSSFMSHIHFKSQTSFIEDFNEVKIFRMDDLDKLYEYLDINERSAFNQSKKTYVLSKGDVELVKNYYWMDYKNFGS